MHSTNLRLLRMKEKALARLNGQVHDHRLTAEGEPSDQRGKERRKLEEEIVVLRQAARIEAEVLRKSGARKRRVNTKEERDELFSHRSKVMRRCLERANGTEVHVKELAKELDRPVTTVKDYYNDQPDVRPTECFWENGIDGSHFRWKDLRENIA